MGVEPQKVESKTQEQKEQKVQKPLKESKNTPFATFATFADRSENLKITVKKMPKCLHNLPCHFITVKDFRQICGRNKQPVFELDHCPIDKWWWAKNQPTTGDKEHE